jgi:hypothetical protein
MHSFRYEQRGADQQLPLVAISAPRLIAENESD